MKVIVREEWGRIKEVEKEIERKRKERNERVVEERRKKNRGRFEK